MLFTQPVYAVYKYKDMVLRRPLEIGSDARPGSNCADNFLLMQIIINNIAIDKKIGFILI